MPYLPTYPLLRNTGRNFFWDDPCAGLAWQEKSFSPAEPSAGVILVSFDGFRWDYVQQYEAKTLKELYCGAAGVMILPSSQPTMAPIMMLARKV